MTAHSRAFIAYLQTLCEKNRGAAAALRHSLAFAPGTDADVFPFVERFAGTNCSADDPRRLALYLVAGLFAQHPRQSSVSFAQAFGALYRERDSASVEQRFITLLEADDDRVVSLLRQAVTLLAADEYPLDYARLTDDLTVWLAPLKDEPRWQALRQNWGRDFYRAALADNKIDTDPEAFVAHLVRLAEAGSNPAAMTCLRRSLASAPGADPKVFPWVEPFVDVEWHPQDARRRARYLVAGLFALHPKYQAKCSFASALNRLARQNGKNSDGIERGFTALLAASSDTVADHLRGLTARLRDSGIGYEPTWLLNDLSIWLRDAPSTMQLDRLRQRWARDFYHVPRIPSESTPEPEETEGA